MTEKSKVLFLNSEGCGTADGDLGYAIMALLLETLPKREDRPSTIIFWNTAVKLLANDSPMLPHLKQLEAKGVKLMAGKLCVNDLGLNDKLGVGQAVSINEILDVILQNEVISL